jgi:uncharacterized flavoprotein (TIGR03862 family)
MHPDIAIIGGGPAGLMAAETMAPAISAQGGAVTVYDRMPTVGRKFLLAGRGGLNLTHSENFGKFLTRYGAAEARLRPALEAFPPSALQAWSEGLGQPTFTGSSGRIFPAAVKASPLLRAWLGRLRALGVRFKLRHRWLGWDADGQLIFETPEGRSTTRAAATILALGGASWPSLGSDGKWVATLMEAGVAVNRLRPSNCGFLANWTPGFRERFQGSPLKGVELRFAGASARGDAIITAAGLEGGPVYALSARLRDAIDADGEARPLIDLRPNSTAKNLEDAFSRPRGKQSLAAFLRKRANISGAAAGLLYEAAPPPQLAALSPQALAALIKAAPVRLIATAPLARAISTAGGTALAELDEHFMVRRRPGLFIAGEMLDWEAPTGGYLLQGCFSTGVGAGRGALRWLRLLNPEHARAGLPLRSTTPECGPAMAQPASSAGGGAASVPPARQARR